MGKVSVMECVSLGDTSVREQQLLSRDTRLGTSRGSTFSTARWSIRFSSLAFVKTNQLSQAKHPAYRIRTSDHQITS
jgi:hypothetical protein